MKQLPKDYTTPEQSKQLLELGVPMWTANIMFDKNRRRYELIETEDESWAETQRTLFYNGGAIPHWSVGRLIEILSICCKLKPAADIFMLAFWGETIDGLIEEITDHTIYYDFSKLED